MCYSAMVENDLAELRLAFDAAPCEDAFKAFNSLFISNPKKCKSIAEHAQIYPNYYAPVVTAGLHGRMILPMRYSIVTPPGENGPTPFNARRDHLASKFWARTFLKHHGIVIIKSFFEWVKAGDLVKAGFLKESDVSKHFEEESLRRKRRLLDQGKRYIPTATEKKDPLMRDMIVHFTPTKNLHLIAPVIFSEEEDVEGFLHRGFAIITAEAPPEIKNTGHDRCPVFITNQTVDLWLNPQGKTAHEIDQLFEVKVDEKFVCCVS